MKTFSSIRKRSIFWSLFLCLIIGNIQAQQFDWANSIGGLGLDVGRAIATDDNGNVFVAGSFTGGTHIADTFLTGYGGMEAFMAKYTSEGQFLWARVISGPAEDMARGLITDNLGNVFVVGHFTDTVVFSITQNDTIAAKSEGMQDVFVAKYDANGNLLWNLTAGGLGNDTGTNIDRYKWSGKLYVSGGFEKRAKFGTTALLSTGLTDAFLLKIDPDGNAHWAKKGGGLEHDMAASVAVNQTNGSIYIAGDFYGQANFEQEEIEAAGSSDVFLAKFQPDGTMEWVRTNGGTSVDVATAIGTDLNGKVYVSGYYQGTTFFQNHLATAISYNDVFVAQFNAEGNCNWLSSAGSWGLDNASGLAVDWDGTTYLTGMFEEQIITATDSSSGNGYEIFVLVHDSYGQVKYVRSAGAASADIGMAACLGPDQSLYLTGYYFYFAEFDNNTIGAADHGDAFVARMTDVLEVDDQSNSNRFVDCFEFNQTSFSLKNRCGLKGSWSIISASGQLIDSETLQGENHLPKLPKGLSFLMVETPNGRFTKKLINLVEAPVSW
ncbi:MAG: hypothetical protein ACI9UR_002029 [Bacteroidia bacterium]|jgi:hypothetical protein